MPCSTPIHFPRVSNMQTNRKTAQNLLIPPPNSDSFQYANKQKKGYQLATFKLLGKMTKDQHKQLQVTYYNQSKNQDCKHYTLLSQFLPFFLFSSITLTTSSGKGRCREQLVHLTKLALFGLHGNRNAQKVRHKRELFMICSNSFHPG